MNAPNPYLDFLIDPSFQGVNRLFALPFNALDDRPAAKVEDYNVMIDGKTFLINQLKII